MNKGNEPTPPAPCPLADLRLCPWLPNKLGPYNGPTPKFQKAARCCWIFLLEQGGQDTVPSTNSTIVENILQGRIHETLFSTHQPAAMVQESVAPCVTPSTDCPPENLPKLKTLHPKAAVLGIHL